MTQRPRGPQETCSLGLSSSPRGLGRGGSLGFSGVARRAGSTGRSLTFTHWEPVDKLSVISVPSFLICKTGMVITPPFIGLWEEHEMVARVQKKHDYHVSYHQLLYYHW